MKKQPMYLTVLQIAKKAGVSRQMIDKRIKSRKVSYEIYGRTRLIEKLVAEKLLTALAVFLLVGSTALAAVPDNLAIRAIMGEASGEGYTGMVAVGEAIRNRGHLKGVYGLKARHIDREPTWVWAQAKKAWEASKTSNLVKGSDHWENTKAFGEPYWAKSMVKTAQIGSHSFYRRKK